MSALKDIPEFIYLLPTKATVLIGYDKLIKNGCSKDNPALHLTLQLIDTWKRQIAHVWIRCMLKKSTRSSYRSISQPRESHQKKKWRKKEPSRRFARGVDQTGTCSQPEDDDVANEQQKVPEPMPGPSSVDEKQPPSRTRTSFQASPVNIWNNAASKELFDIISMAKINWQEKAYMFDEEFYNDQKGQEQWKWKEK